MDERTPILHIENLTTGYAGVPVVRGIDLDVYEGEVVSLLGPNGAGKTTTLITVAGLLPTLGGFVQLLGQQADTDLFERLTGGNDRLKLMRVLPGVATLSAWIASASPLISAAARST